MSVESFIEEVVNLDIDFTEAQINELLDVLKKAYETMESIFRGTSVTDRHLRPYKSLLSKEMIQKKRHEMPDIFYNFIDENVTIYVWKSPSDYYYIACRHLELTREERKAIVYEYDLFKNDEYNIEMLESNGQIHKYYPTKELEKAIFTWRKVINYYVQSTNRNNRYQRNATKIY